MKRASFAEADATVQLTGLPVGGVTAVGIQGLPIYVDSAVPEQESIIMGGGNRSTKLRLSPRELLKLPHVQIIDGLARARE